MDLDDFKEQLEMAAFGATKPGTCVKCKEAFSDKNVHTQAGWRETKISKMCENCWDNLFKAD